MLINETELDIIKIYEESTQISKGQTTFTKEQTKEIGDSLGVNWDEISLEQMTMGMNVEAEHGDVTGNNPIKIFKIALAHTRENEKYYDLLKKMEQK